MSYEDDCQWLLLRFASCRVLFAMRMKRRWLDHRTWMVLQRSLAVRLFDLVRRRIALQPEDLVWVNDWRFGLHVIFDVGHVEVC